MNKPYKLQALPNIRTNNFEFDSLQNHPSKFEPDPDLAVIFGAFLPEIVTFAVLKWDDFLFFGIVLTITI